MLCLYTASGTFPWNSARTIPFASSSFTPSSSLYPLHNITTKTPHSYILHSKWHRFKTQTFQCVRTVLTNTRRQHRLLLSTPRSCRRPGAMRHLPPVCITASTARGFATSPDTQSTREAISHRPRALQTHCNYFHFSFETTRTGQKISSQRMFTFYSNKRYPGYELDDPGIDSLQG